MGKGAVPGKNQMRLTVRKTGPGRLPGLEAGDVERLKPAEPAQP